MKLSRQFSFVVSLALVLVLVSCSSKNNESAGSKTFNLKSTETLIDELPNGSSPIEKAVFGKKNPSTTMDKVNETLMNDFAQCMNAKGWEYEQDVKPYKYYPFRLTPTIESLEDRMERIKKFGFGVTTTLNSEYETDENLIDEFDLEFEYYGEPFRDSLDSTEEGQFDKDQSACDLKEEGVVFTNGHFMYTLVDQFTLGYSDVDISTELYQNKKVVEAQNNWISCIKEEAKNLGHNDWTNYILEDIPQEANVQFENIFEDNFLTDMDLYDSAERPKKHDRKLFNEYHNYELAFADLDYRCQLSKYFPTLVQVANQLEQEFVINHQTEIADLKVTLGI